MDKVNLVEKFSQFSEHYSPKIVGEINDTYVKLAKLRERRNGGFPPRT